MTAEELRAIHEDYRRTIEVARDEAASDEARANAKAAILDLRHKLDDALIENEEARELEKQAELVEARARMMEIVAKADNPQNRRDDVRWEEVRTGVVQAHEKGLAFNRSFQLVLPTRQERARELRTEYDVSTAASGAYGSYLVPQTWANTIITEMEAQSGVLEAGPTIFRTTQGGQMNLPTLATDIAAAAITEGSAATQDTPVFGTVPLNTYSEGGYFIITEDLLADAGPDVDTYLARLAGRAIAERVAYYLGDEDIGTGSGAPAAITVGATSAVTAASVDTITIDELVQLYGAVGKPYRKQGKWLVNNDIFVDMLLAKAGDGQYLTHPALSAPVADTFLGKPLIEEPYFDTSATGNKVAGFGDVASAYAVRFIGPVQIDFSAEAGFTSFEVYCRYKIRFDAATLLANAFKVITLA